MKKQDKKELKGKILIAFKHALVVNKADLSGKMEKVLKKSIKKIVKKLNEKKDKISGQKSKNSILKSNKTKTGKQLPK